MRHAHFVVTTTVLSVVVACGTSGSGGGGSSGTLDCNFLEGANCYKSTVAAAASCLPPAGSQGTLSADGKTCTYASGQTVTFDTPLTLPLSSQPLFNFTVTSAGAECLRFQESTQTNFTVTTSAGAFNENASQSLVVTCPNGVTYSTSNEVAILGCDGGLGIFPGEEDSSGSTSVSFSLLGTGATPTSVFNCMKM